jgi:hypothetical protein
VGRIFALEEFMVDDCPPELSNRVVYINPNTAAQFPSPVTNSAQRSKILRKPSKEIDAQRILVLKVVSQQ